jgi:hypothetical protein
MMILRVNRMRLGLKTVDFWQFLMYFCGFFADFWKKMN